MQESSLAKKMKMKPHQRAVVINAPQEYLEELSPLPEGVELCDKLRGKFDWVQVFARSKAELEKLAPKAIRALKPGSLLWVSFPKGTSKVQGDLTRDKGWEVIQQADLKWVSLISVNGVWSAIALRPYKAGEERQSFRRP